MPRMFGLVALGLSALLSIVSCQEEKRQWTLPGYPPGDYMTGWKSLPTASDAGGTVYQSWSVAGGSIPVYQTDNEETRVTRAVIFPPGLMRDCWYYYKTAYSGLQSAQANSTDIKIANISIMSPCFLAYMDDTAGAAVPGNLVWNRTTWISGHYNVNPAVAADVSSFDVMDGLVEYYMDRTRFPNLKAVVVAGHSAGAQMAQRYMMLRKSTSDDDRLQWWMGNPSSYAWLTSDRPYPNATCEGFDNWKYGLSDKFPGYATGDARRLGREGLVARYRSRYAHYILGTLDNLAGDTRCQANMQGSTHLDRGRSFQTMLNSTGGFPANSTLDYLPVWHDVDSIVHMAVGQDRLFRWMPGETSIPAPPPPTTTTSVTAPQATQTHYGQCGGTGYNGPTACAAPYTCQAVSPPYYYQCL